MITFGYTYLFSKDLAQAKHFYQNLLGLHLIWDEPQDIAFSIAGHQLSIHYAENAEPLKPAFSRQPGWQGGTEARVSWSINYDGEEFSQVVHRLQEAKAASFHPEPQWQGYWSFPVLDPMNQTIEITTSDDYTNDIPTTATATATATEST